MLTWISQKILAKHFDDFTQQLLCVVTAKLIHLRGFPDVTHLLDSKMAANAIAAMKFVPPTNHRAILLHLDK